MKHVMAILFDLHHTLTDLELMEIPAIWRRLSIENGVNLSDIDVDKVWEVMKSTDPIIHEYGLRNNVGPHFGNEPKDWLYSNRILYERLGFKDLPDEVIIKIEKEFQIATVDEPFERIIDDGLSTIKELHRRGYLLGICTRRPTNPDPLLNRYGVRELFGSIQWSGVRGYAKPNPYTLLQAAKELGINPRRCAFVGNYVGADIEAANRCEMMPILLTWANPDEGSKAPEGTLVLENPSELLQVFDSPSGVGSSN